jgi:hypothetical protein
MESYQKLFRLIPKGLNLPAEQWQSCVHFPADARSAVSDTPQNNVPAGHETLLNKILRGIRPRGVKEVLRDVKPRNNRNEFETELKNILGCEFRDCMGSIRGKNQRSNILRHCPLK